MEWDETERDWWRALEEYETKHTCPVCGLDPDFCHDSEKVHDMFADAEIETCYVGAMRETAMHTYREHHKNDIAPNSRLTRLVPYEFEIIDDDQE